MKTASQPLLSVSDCITRMLASAERHRQQQPLLTERVVLVQSSGRILADNVLAAVDVPPADNSAMDGIAFNWQQAQQLPSINPNTDNSVTHNPASSNPASASSGIVRGGEECGCAEQPVSSVPETGWRSLRLSQHIPAGAVTVPLLPLTAARIFTGAELPSGADTVQMQENCHFTEHTTATGTVEKWVHFQLPKAAAANVRPQGQDIAKGAAVVQSGQLLGPLQLGQLASVGMAEVTVYRRLRVVLLSTGDELIEPGQPLAAGQIYNSNAPLVISLLSGWGCAVTSLGQIADDPDSTRRALQQAQAMAPDLILSSGGVSVGEEDHVKAAVEACGSLDLWKVAIKPGKPIAWGQVGDIPFVGLPGNPQSVWITALILLRPFVMALQRRHWQAPTPLLVPAGFERTKPQGRDEFVRVQVQHTATGSQLIPHPNQSSGALTSAAWADGLMHIPAGSTVTPGQAFAYWPMALLMH